MRKSDTITPYDKVAMDYDRKRKPSPAILQALTNLLSSVPPEGLILSIGCGTGQYEEALRHRYRIVGLDKSETMLGIARSRMERCVCGDMLQLPFDNESFDAVYFMQSLHHVGANLDITQEERNAARLTAIREAVRVLRDGPLAIIQRDPSQNRAVWFWKYFPEALKRKLIIQPAVTTICTWLRALNLEETSAKPLDDPMIEGFYDARAPLEPAFQHAFSEFSYLSPVELEAGMTRLQKAIADSSVTKAIDTSKREFAEIGGSVFLVSARKPPHD